MPGPKAIKIKAILSNRGWWYLVGALCLGLLAGAASPWWVTATGIWFAANCLYLAIGYLFSFNGLLLKSPEGRIPLLVKALLLPFFVVAHGYNWVKRKTDRVPPIQAVTDRLYLGRRLLPTDIDLLEAQDVTAVLDVTAEFDALDFSLLGKDIAYLNLPVFDHGVPGLAQLHKAVSWIDRCLAENRRVVIHCALGRGRSATVLLAYLLFSDAHRDIRDAVETVRQRRMTVSPNFSQLRLLERYCQSNYLKRVPRAMLIVNPAAGRGDHETQIEEARRYLSSYLQLQTCYTTPECSANALARRAVAAGYDKVIAAGGDGTVSAVASAIISTPLSLGIIPLGTANALATCLYGAGVHLQNVQVACERIVNGKDKRIDTATCNGEPMLLMAGVGVEKGMIERAEGAPKSQWGALAYLYAALQEIRSPQSLQVTLVADHHEETFTTPSLVVANGAPVTSVFARGGGEPLYDDGLLDITWLKPAQDTSDTVASMAELLRSGLTNQAGERYANHRRARRIRVSTEPPTEVAVDGELMQHTPLDIQVNPGSLSVVQG